MKTSPIDDATALAGRVLIAVLFVPSALGKLANLSVVSQAIGAKGLPLPALLAVAVIALEVVASAAIVAGWRVRWAALALGAFTLVAGFLFHDFWNAPQAIAMAQQQAFFKNVGIVGGLLLLAAHGPGRFAISSSIPPVSPSLHPEKG